MIQQKKNRILHLKLEYERLEVGKSLVDNEQLQIQTAAPRRQTLACDTVCGETISSRRQVISTT